MADERRRFNDGERVELYLQAGGKCAHCGADLRPGWHADHKQPYSLGGPTSIENGQAFCLPCNLKKGARMSLGEWRIPLRDWQEEALQIYVGKNKQDYLEVATPGSGKTMFAIAVMHYLLRSGIVRRIVVVCPSEPLRTQWAEDAYEAGIHLNPEWRAADGGDGGDFCGIVITYAAVAEEKRAELLRQVCARVPTAVFFDEIHHLAATLAWGESAKFAFEPAVRRVGLSGTCFRSDGNEIPFVTYRDGVSVADHAYDYNRALKTGDCPMILFPHYEGEMEWEYKGRKKEASFSDPLSEDDSARRLKTFLDPAGETLADLLREADEKLTEVQGLGHPNPGGLVTCIDQDHARRVAQLLYKVCGTMPAIAVSDDRLSTSRIKTFKGSASRWLVSVKMVSEGVSIPRLRVGVYATNVLSELFFRQFVGRLVRIVPDLEEQTGYTFIPADPTLIGYARTFQEERDHELMSAPEKPKEVNGGAPEEREPSSFNPLGSRDLDFQGHIQGQDTMRREEIAGGKALHSEIQLSAALNDSDLAKLFRAFRAAGGVPPGPQPGTAGPAATKAAEGRPVFRQRKEATTKRKNLAGKFANTARYFAQDPRPTLGEMIQAVYRKLGEITGIWGRDITLAKAEEQNALLQEWIRALGEARRQGRAQIWLEQWEATRGLD